MYKLAVKAIDDVNSACAGGHLHSHGIYFYSATVSILDCRDEYNILRLILEKLELLLFINKMKIIR
jgi:hypothetical protein